jgi:hypothetical protein
MGGDNAPRAKGSDSRMGMSEDLSAEIKPGESIEQAKAGLQPLFHQIIDGLLLPLVQPTCYGDYEKRKWIQTRSHRVDQYLRRPANAHIILDREGVHMRSIALAFLILVSAHAAHAEITEAKVDENGKPILDKDGKPIFVTVNRPTKVLDLINQRPLIEGEIERRIRPEAQKSCVTIREVRLGEPAIPPELLVAVRREQLATQLARAFIQERAAQEKRVDSEKAKATADQQSKLVESEINVQRSVQNAQAARNEGQGERDKLSLISEGQQKQVGVLGPESTVKLRQFELLLDTIARFANAHPEVFTAALTNAQKFVPNVQVGSGSEGVSGLLTAILGQNLAGAALPSTPGTSITQTPGTPAKR